MVTQYGSHKRGFRLGTVGSAVAITAVAGFGVIKGIARMNAPTPAGAATVAPPQSADNHRAWVTPSPATRPATAIGMRPSAPATLPAVTTTTITTTTPPPDRKTQLSAIRALRDQVGVLSDLRAQVMLYKLQHGNRLPELMQYPGWRQLIERTDADGVPALGGRCGPYLRTTPVNPINRRADVLLVSKAPNPGDRVSAPDVGFVFDKTTGRVWMTDAAGCVLDDLAVIAASQAADAEAPPTQEPFRILPPAEGRVAMQSAMRMLRSQIALYKLMHEGDRAPDFSRRNPWEQLTSRTRPDGVPDPNGHCGPFYDAPPRNVLNGSSDFAIVQRLAPLAKSNAAAAARHAGYVYETASGRVWATDENWNVVRD